MEALPAIPLPHLATLHIKEYNFQVVTVLVSHMHLPSFVHTHFEFYHPSDGDMSPFFGVITSLVERAQADERGIEDLTVIRRSHEDFEIKFRYADDHEEAFVCKFWCHYLPPAISVALTLPIEHVKVLILDGWYFDVSEFEEIFSRTSRVEKVIICEGAIDTFFQWMSTYNPGCLYSGFMEKKAQRERKRQKKNYRRLEDSQFDKEGTEGSWHSCNTCALYRASALANIREIEIQSPKIKPIFSLLLFQHLVFKTMVGKKLAALIFRKQIPNAISVGDYKEYVDVIECDLSYLLIQ
ncbi:hypothetical protein AX16_003329 [Volvariella volvacea WC 439]|nr:hypothetical protein AX16_003329 [Volvariella volvacea WC 439]